MTDEERIKSILSECEHGFISYDNLRGRDENFQPNHGFRIIKESLEKRISKKPIDKIDVHPVYGEGGAYVDADIIVHFYCPCCDEWVGSDQGEISPYCNGCGQKIKTDWSEEDD